MRYGYTFSATRPVTSIDGCDMNSVPTIPLPLASPPGNRDEVESSRSRAFSTAPAAITKMRAVRRRSIRSACA